MHACDACDEFQVWFSLSLYQRQHVFVFAPLFKLVRIASWIISLSKNFTKSLLWIIICFPFPKYLAMMDFSTHISSSALWPGWPPIWYIDDPSIKALFIPSYTKHASPVQGSQLLEWINLWLCMFSLLSLSPLNIICNVVSWNFHG